MDKRSYYAVVKRPSYAKPIQIWLEAYTISAAIDTMYFQCGAEKPEDVTEYELYEVVGKDRYRPVAGKPASGSNLPVPLAAATVEEVVFTEKVYKSYRDAA